jgi:imidazole glycerol-phosphate synthase subunit HisF
MLLTRFMPCLLLLNGSLVKTVRFRDPAYIGDPINAIRIYNDLEVDELVFLDIMATVERRPPPFETLREIASECFMPVAYGGGIRTLDEIAVIFRLGVEKVVINTQAIADPELVMAAARRFGSQSIVVSIDARRTAKGFEVFTRGGRQATGLDPAVVAKQMAEAGAGEIFLTSIDRDGTMQGYDLDLVRSVVGAVRVPVIACGGAGTVEHLGQAIKQGGAAAVAAGSMVVYFGRNRAVLINVPEKEELDAVLTK